MDKRRGGRGGGGGPNRGMRGSGGGSGGPPRGGYVQRSNNDWITVKPRQSNTRYNGGYRPGGGRGHNPRFSHTSNREAHNSSPMNDIIGTAKTTDERPRLVLDPRTLLDFDSERNLSQRSLAIFGEGKPREASPARDTPKSIGRKNTSIFSLNCLISDSDLSASDSDVSCESD